MSGFNEVFKAISHSTRRELLTFLAHHKEEVLSGDINQRFPVSWVTLCNHLEILVQARLVKKRKQGREVFYSIHRQRLIGIVKTWIESFE